MARSLAYSFLGLSLWPRTHRHSTACPPAACTSFCHSGRFSTAPPLRRQPRVTQPGTHSFIPLIRYSESDTYVTRALRHCRCSHSSVAMAPASAMRLLVVSGEHSYKSQRATLSPAGASISAALPPGLGGSMPLPRQLSSACTSTRIGAVFSGISGLDHHRDVGVAQDLLGVGHHDGAGPALLMAQVGPGEQRVAAGSLDHLGDHLPRLAGLDMRHERHPLHREQGFRDPDHLQSGVAILRSVDQVHRAPDHRGEPGGELERPLAGLAPVERERTGGHRRGQPAAHDHAALGDPDQGGRGGAESVAFGGDAAPSDEHGVRRLGELGERDVGLTFAFGELGLQARRDEPLTGAIEHRRAVRGAPAPLPYVRHYHRAAEPLSQHHRLLEGRVGPRAAIESHQQSSEHAYGSTAKDSSSRSGNSRISPVIGSLPSSASSRSPVSSRSATTTYSVPRRRSATRRRSRTARSKASSASGVSLVNSRIVATGPRYPTATRPGGPATTRPMTAAAGASARASAVTSAWALSGATAISSPPDVCASHSSTRVVSSTPTAKLTASAMLVRLRCVPPGTAPRAAMSRACGNSGTACAVTSAAAPLASSRLCRWPSRPNPVTSVAAWTPTASIARAAAALRVVITVTAGASSGSESKSRFSAVVRTPVPIGLVSTRASPGRAPALVTMRSGCTSPITAMPYLGSGSSMEWPPKTNAPAARATSAPPRSTSPSRSYGRVSRGQPTRLRASSGVAPMA